MMIAGGKLMMTKMGIEIDLNQPCASSLSISLGCTLSLLDFLPKSPLQCKQLLPHEIFHCRENGRCSWPGAVVHLEVPLLLHRAFKS